MTGTLDQAYSRVLACPECQGYPLDITTALVGCTNCEWEAARVGRVVSVGGDAAEVEEVQPAERASFDDKFEMLGEHNHHPVVWELCYRRQSDEISDVLSTSVAECSGDRRVLLDIGCGPTPPYTIPEAGFFTVGVDPSFPSLAANAALDLGLHTSATKLPLGNDSVDVVLAIYAVHHMIGASIGESWQNVEAVFGEMARVAKPGATVLILEICPWPPTWVVERIGWKASRRLIGEQVDFVFWPMRALTRLGARAFPGAETENHRFSVSPFAVFPPVIGHPKLKVPRLLYPLGVRLFRWTLPNAPD